MPTGTRLAVVLPPELQASLLKLVNARNCPAKHRRNARVLLLRAAGVPYRLAADQAGCSPTTVREICRRYLAGGWLKLCQEAPRGRPREHPQARREQLLAWATADPQACGMTCSRWSLAAFQRLWQRTYGEPPPARETLRRWLRAANIPWYRTRSWCTSNDPHYHEKTAAVCALYCHPPDDTAVLCYDQKPHLQALSRRVDNRPPQPGKPGRQEHDYRRHGTLCLHALLDARTGRTDFSCRSDHRSETIATLLGRWVTNRPESRVALVMDNLSANHAKLVRHALEASGKEVVVYRTATYSSWQNQVERVFADLQRELLDHARAETVGGLEYQIAAWFGERNAIAAPYRWTFEPASVMSKTGH